MSISNSDKKFIDIDEEINFVVERIGDSEKDRVIVVVPQNALVASSLVSLKILARQIAKSKKLVILVMEDEFALELSERAGLQATRKVSDITPDMWEAAQILKEKLKGAFLETKEKLLTERGSINNGEGAERVEIEEVHEEPEEEIKEVEEEEDQSEENEIEEEKTPEEEITLPIRKKRNAKLISVSGIQIMAGGDISGKSDGVDKSLGNGNITSPNSDSNTNMDKEDTSSKKTSSKRTNGFTGRDWTNIPGSDKKKKKANLFGRKKKDKEREIAGEFMDSPKKGRRTVKIIAVITVVLVMLLGLAGYLLAFQWASVEVKISLQTQEVPVEQQITAEIDRKEIDLENLIIPAQIVTVDNLSISASDNATGTGQTGNKASGLIDIWNKTTDEVKLSKGTVLQNTTTNLKYVLDEAVTVPAADFDGDVLSDVGQVQDVSMIASEFGEEYNITEAGTKVDFKVGDFSTENVIGKRFRDIEGGSLEEFTAVSQEDEDRVKNGLEDDLFEQGKHNLTDVIPAGFRLVPGTEKLIDLTVSTVPEIDVEEAETFTTSLEAKLTAVIVAEDDLQQALAVLIENNSELEGEFDIDQIADVQIANVEVDEKEITFTLSSSGSLVSNVSEESLKQELSGKTLEEAREFLNSVPQIVSFRIRYNFDFIPEMLKRIPTNPEKLRITFN